MSCSAQREAQLKAQGWTRQFLAAEPRLSEAVDEYRELGFQVRLEPVDPVACAQDVACTTCFARPEVAALHKVIFTRLADVDARDQNLP
jgi:hypothetical protein